jgi:anti-sigma regulatory factor (Ser/Thr protein kinase)
MTSASAGGEAADSLATPSPAVSKIPVGMDTVYRETFDIEGGDFSRAGTAASRVKQILKEIGLDNQFVKRAVIIAYEAEINVVSYASRGQMTLAVSPSRIQLIVEDVGPGIADIELAMQEGYSTAADWVREMGFGAGMGLPNIKRNSDSLKIESEVGSGTKVFAEVAMAGAGGTP